MTAVCVDDDALMLAQTVSCCRAHRLLTDVQAFTSSPEALAWLILQGKKAKSVSWEGLMLVLGLKLVLLIGTLAGILPLWTAVLADSGMALLAACNALRLK